MRISEAARLVGVPTHVLRHWEDEGVLCPDRVGANQRDFTPAHLDEARIILRLRHVGVSLPDLLELRTAQQHRQADVLRRAAERLRVEARRAAYAADFLEHTLECRHPIISECPTCHRYAAGASPRRPRPRRPVPGL